MIVAWSIEAVFFFVVFSNIMSIPLALGLAVLVATALSVIYGLWDNANN
jgi:hypothetical protein